MSHNLYLSGLELQVDFKQTSRDLKQTSKGLQDDFKCTLRTLQDYSKNIIRVMQLEPKNTAPLHESHRQPKILRLVRMEESENTQPTDHFAKC